MKPNPKQVLTAQNLLDFYIDFQRYTPDIKDWKEKTLIKSPPRMYRYQMINSLLKAFGICDKLTRYFIDGVFLENKLPIDYKYLVSMYKVFIKNENSSNGNETTKDIATSLPTILKQNEIKYLFERLLEYRTKIDNVVQYNDGVYAAPPVDLFNQHFIQAYIKQSKVFQVKIDKLLCSIIDPQNKKFTIKELIKDYNYPDVDLDKIDFDLL